jgi:hypothetical protein
MTVMKSRACFWVGSRFLRFTADVSCYSVQFMHDLVRIKYNFGV